MNTAPIANIHVIVSPKNIMEIITEVIGTKVWMIPVSVAERYWSKDNQKLYAKDVDKIANRIIRKTPRTLIDISRGGIRKAKKTNMIEPNDKLTKVTRRGFSSEKNFFRKTVYRAHRMPDPKASRLPTSAPMGNSLRLNKYSLKITKKSPPKERVIANAYIFLILSFKIKKAKIGIKTTFAFNKKDAVEAVVSLTARKRNTGMKAEKMATIMYFNQLLCREFQMSLFLTFDWKIKMK